MTAVDGLASYPGGQSFDLLILPAMPATSMSAFSKILELAQSGVNILLSTTVPSRSIGLVGNDTEI